MDVQQLISQGLGLFPGNLSGIPVLSPELWGKASAVVILWIYLMMSAGREAGEA